MTGSPFLFVRHPEAEDELDSAIDWYDAFNPGQGERLLDMVEVSERAIDEMPEAWAVFPGWRRRSPIVRSHRLAKFPYRIVYYVKDDRIIILAYAHTSRKPGYWRHLVNW